MSSQKPGKSKQKSLLSWVKPQDTKAKVEDENAIIEEPCAAGVPEQSSEGSQDYVAVESVEAIVSHCQLPLITKSAKKFTISFQALRQQEQVLPAWLV